jgi:hypothetical protein
MKQLVLAAAVATLVAVSPAAAQESVTVQMRSGEQLKGQLVDLNAQGYEVTVNGATRHLPASDVAVISFNGSTAVPSSARSQVQSGQQAIVLKSGEVVAGHVTDVSGKTPLKVSLDVSGNTRTFDSNEISAIVLAQPTTAVGTSGVAAAGGRTISVAANASWIDTGVTVRAGQQIGFHTTGQVTLNADGSKVAESAGSATDKTAAGAPLPNAALGALIGRVGTNGQPFGIGNQTSVPMPATGRLYLMVNDSVLSDNSGAFEVQISE